MPNFHKQPRDIQIVLVDMAFNLGDNGLGKFVKFRKALMRYDYKSAADEMIDSKWYYQVGNRSKELVQIVRGHQSGKKVVL